MKGFTFLKNFTVFAAMLFFSIAIAVPAFPVTQSDTVDAVETVEELEAVDIAEVVEVVAAVSDIEPGSYFVSLGALVALVLALTQLLKKIIGSEKEWTKFISWVIAMLVSVVGWKMNLGIFEGIQIYFALLYGLIAGFVANEVFDLVFGEGIMNLIRSLIGKERK